MLETASGENRGPFSCSAAGTSEGLTGIKALGQGAVRTIIGPVPPEKTLTPEAATETAAPPTTPYERIGGEPVLRAIVDRFYDLMDADSAYAQLRAMHAPDLAPMRASLTSFFTGFTGGPRDWFDSGKCVMSLHRPMAISAETSAQWMDAMRRAVNETVGGSDPEIAKAMLLVLEQMVQGMARSPAHG